MANHLVEPPELSDGKMPSPESVVKRKRWQNATIRYSNSAIHIRGEGNENPKGRHEQGI